ncbi:MAG TPA: PQQ-dependent sugar dehydrogenase [Gammaproteobacteria bacterium]|nr:PQQ-dependent sugar dehydrogenase [Gammaproteobacteria bacterium]
MHRIFAVVVTALAAYAASAPACGQDAPATARPPRFVTPELGDGPWELDTEAARVRVSVVTKGLDHPWAIAFVPGGDMLVTERPGRLRVIRAGSLDPEPIAGLPPIEPGLIGGLLDLALHPQFTENRLIYFSYSTPDPEDPMMSTTAVARARWDGGNRLESLENVFIADAWHGNPVTQRIERCCGQGPAGGSYGSRIVFDAEGYLYVTIGDRNYGEMVQDAANHFGKIVRIHDDGSIPQDNPFFGLPDHHGDIYSTGHRNPLGLTIHPSTGALWESEFGPRGGDEVNVIEAGNNYGWMLVTHGEHYNDDPVELGTNDIAGFVDPVLHWEPSINPGNIVFPMTDEFPGWRGDMLMATMSRSLLRVSFDAQGEPDAQEKMLTELGQRLRDVRQGPDGRIYVLTDETAGAVLALEAAD